MMDMGMVVNQMATNGPEKSEDKIKNILELHGCFLLLEHFATTKTKRYTWYRYCLLWVSIFIEVKAPNGKSKVKNKRKG